jgi:hypothetical protein
MADASFDDNPLDALVEEFLARYRRGERPPISEFTRRRPELAEDIRELFPALVMLEDVRPGASAGWCGASVISSRSCEHFLRQSRWQQR